MLETDKSIVIAEIEEIKWQSNTGQSVLKSKGLYRTGGHFTRLVRRSDGISFSLYTVVYLAIINMSYDNLNFHMQFLQGCNWYGLIVLTKTMF
jgi:hypothetical protein